MGAALRGFADGWARSRPSATPQYDPDNCPIHDSITSFVQYATSGARMVKIRWCHLGQHELMVKF